MLTRAPSVLFILSAVALSAAMANRSMDPLVTAVARDFDVTIATAAAVVSIYALPYAFGQPVLGPVGDYYGKMRLLRICMWAQCLTLLMVAISPTIGVLMAARFFGGIAGGGIMPIGMAIISDRYGPAQRHQAIATFVSIALVGYIFAVATAGYLAVYVSWRAIFAIALLTSIIALLMMRSISDEGPRPNKPMQVSDAVNGYKTLFSNPRAVLCYGGVFLEGIALWGTLPFISPLLEARHRGSTAEAGLIVMAMGIGSLAFTGGVRWWLRLMSHYKFMFLGGFVSAIGPMTMAFDIPWVWLAFAYGLSGFGFMMLHNSIQAEVAGLAPGVRGLAFAMHSSSFFIGQAIGPMLLALGLATVGGFVSLTAFAAILAAVGPAVSALFLRANAAAEGRG